jgi:hypothetical protein
MRSLRCRIAVLLLVATGSLVMPLPSHAGASRISAQAVEGWVVDGAGKPLPDVVVMAHWTLEGSMIGPTTRELTILETTTDASGHYFIPAWGPKDVSFPLYMLSDDPLLHFFKSGYQFVTKDNRANVSRERRQGDAELGMERENHRSRETPGRTRNH